MPKKPKHSQKLVRINLTIAPGLLDLVDQAAEQEFTTRSDIIRTALLWYVRPQGRELAQTDPDEILKILKQRQTKAAIKNLISNP